MALTRILSHNVYWFQGHPFKTDQPSASNPAVLNALTTLYQTLHPTLICLQEIQSQSTASALSTLLHKNHHYTPGRQLPQYGTTSLSENLTPIIDSSSALLPPQRAWQIVQHNSLSVANVHLPSSRQLPGPKAAQQRILELQSLLELHPQTDIILGDFNESSSPENPGLVSDFFTSQNFLDAGVLLHAADLPTNATSVKNRRGDQIWLKKHLAPRLRHYNVVSEPAMRSTLPNITHLSDHFPLYIDLDLNP